MFPITKNAPIPPRSSSRKGQSKYPFHEMEINDSFQVVAPEGRSVDQIRTRLLAATSRQARLTGKRFTTRKIDDRSVGVWRVK